MRAAIWLSMKTRQISRRAGGTMDFILAGIIGVLLGCYLVYALLCPEKF